MVKVLEKAEILNAFITPVFTGKTCFQQCWVPETIGKVCNKEDFPLVEEDQVSKHLYKLDIQKSLGADALATKAANSFLGCIRQSITYRLQPVILPFSALMRHIWSTGSNAGLPSGQETWTS